MEFLDINDSGYITLKENIDFQADVEQMYNDNLETPDLKPETFLGQEVVWKVDYCNYMQEQFIKYINMFNINTTSNVERTANQLGFWRKTSSYTVNKVIFTGTPTSIVPIGTALKDTSGNFYNTTQLATIGVDGTSGYIQVVSELPAVSSDINTINTFFEDAPAGIDSVNNPVNYQIKGTNAETDQAFAERVNNTQENIKVLNTINQLTGYILQNDKVIDCVGLENYTDFTEVKKDITMTRHSIAMVIVGGTNDFIGEAFAKAKEPGCDTLGDTFCYYSETLNGETITNQYRYYIPANNFIAVQFTVSVNTLTNLDYQNLIRNQILNYIQTNPFKIAKNIFSTDFIRAFSLANVNVEDVAIKNITTSGDWVDKLEFQYLNYPILLAENITFVEV